MVTTNNTDQDPEILAITQVHNSLRGLDADSQQRVIDYVARKLGLSLSATTNRGQETRREDRVLLPDGESGGRGGDDDSTDLASEDSLDGISPAARKWIKRSGFAPDQLSKLFSLGIDEIDLVATKVPGSSKRDKTRSVILLKGVAAYLGSGVPRVTYEQIKEACQHYGAFDSPNFAKYLKSMTSEVSGTKEGGFSLTARGLTEATEMVRGMIA